MHTAIIFFKKRLPDISECLKIATMLTTVVLEKTLESPLDCKEMQPVHSKGDQSLVFIRGTDAEAKTAILQPPDVKSWLIWKDSDGGKDWKQEGKGMTEDELPGCHYQLGEHEFE